MLLPFLFNNRHSVDDLLIPLHLNKIKSTTENVSTGAFSLFPYTLIGFNVSSICCSAKMLIFYDFKFQTILDLPYKKDNYVHLREWISTAIMTVTPKMREIKFRLNFCRSRIELTLKPFLCGIFSLIRYFNT